MQLGIQPWDVAWVNTKWPEKQKVKCKCLLVSLLLSHFQMGFGSHDFRFGSMWDMQIIGFGSKALGCPCWTESAAVKQHLAPKRALQHIQGAKATAQIDSSAQC